MPVRKPTEFQKAVLGFLAGTKQRTPRAGWQEMFLHTVLLESGYKIGEGAFHHEMQLLCAWEWLRQGEGKDPDVEYPITTYRLTPEGRKAFKAIEKGKSS